MYKEFLILKIMNMIVIPDEFKSLVCDVVQDGKIDKDEEEALLKKAEELNIPFADALLYIRTELKKRQAELEKLNKPKKDIDWNTIIQTVVSIVGPHIIKAGSEFIKSRKK